jgi:hypothetical protein
MYVQSHTHPVGLMYVHAVPYTSNRIDVCAVHTHPIGLMQHFMVFFKTPFYFLKTHRRFYIDTHSNVLRSLIRLLRVYDFTARLILFNRICIPSACSLIDLINRPLHACRNIRHGSPRPRGNAHIRETNLLSQMRDLAW